MVIMIPTVYGDLLPDHTTKLLITHNVLVPLDTVGYTCVATAIWTFGLADASPVSTENARGC